MRERLCGYLVVLLIFFSEKSSGQALNTSYPARFSLRTPALVTAGKQPITVIPSGFYYRSLGFFCKQELQLQHVTKVPVLFRVGSVDYTNYMERKPQARFLFR
jgi:hypothetical protein